jgi:hypothetical protein
MLAPGGLGARRIATAVFWCRRVGARDSAAAAFSEREMPGAAFGSARSAPVLAAVEAGPPNRTRQNKYFDRILTRLISGCVLDESRCVLVPTRAKFAYRMICLLRVQTRGFGAPSWLCWAAALAGI